MPPTVLGRPVHSIRQKLLWGIGVPALLVALLGLAFFSQRARLAAVAAAEEQADALGDLVSSSFALTPVPGALGAEQAHPAVAPTLEAAAVFRGVKSLRVLGPGGRVEFSKEPEEVGGTGTPAPLGISERIDVQRSEVLLARRLGEPRCEGCHAARLGPPGQLQLSVSTPRLIDQVEGGTRAALIAMLLFALALAGLTALSLHVFLTRPLRRLSGAMKRAEHGDFLVRADGVGRDEIGQLSGAFNRMLETMTSLKAEELETHRDLAVAQAELSLKTELETTNAELQSRLNALALLYHVSRSLTATLELPELLARISVLVTERLRVDHFSVMLLNAENRLEVVASVPPRAGGTRATFGLDEGAYGRAARTLLPVYLPDLGKAEDDEVRREGSEPNGSLLCLPVIHQGKLLGVLNLERPEANGFNAAEVELLAAVADQAAMAIQNAHLHAETVSLSITDALTGVANRRHLFAQLELEVARAARFKTQVAVVMLDLDHFKRLNDAEGHPAGDVVLREVADLMSSQVRKVDTLARYGGEEFLLVLPQISKSEAGEVAEKLRRSVAEFRFTSGRITLSAGVSHLPGDAATPEGLIDAADAALYTSKRTGRNRVTLFEVGMERHPGRLRGPHARKARHAPTGTPLEEGD